STSLRVSRSKNRYVIASPRLVGRRGRRTERRGAGGASVSVVVIGSTSRRRVPGDGLVRQRYGRAPRLCSALPSPPGTCGKPPGSLLLLGVGRLLGGKPSSVLLLGVRSRSPVVHPLHNV